MQQLRPSAAKINKYFKKIWHIIYSRPSYPQFLCICDFCILWSASCGLCSTVIFTIEKSLHVSGPPQFKSLLLQGQLWSIFILFEYMYVHGYEVLIQKKYKRNLQVKFKSIKETLLPHFPLQVSKKTDFSSPT